MDVRTVENAQIHVHSLGSMLGVSILLCVLLIGVRQEVSNHKHDVAGLGLETEFYRSLAPVSMTDIVRLSTFVLPATLYAKV